MEGKVFVISSVVQGNGAKYVAMNLAFEMQKKYKDKKVLLVDFDFENPFLAHEYVKNDEVHGIDNLVNSINSEGLTEELFEENIINTSLNVDVLRGTKFIDKQKQFTKEQIETVIEFSKKMYDYVYIVVNGRSNNAGTVYGLLNADEVILVVKNNYSNLLKIERVYKMVSQYYKKQNEINILFNFKNLNAKSDINAKLEGYKVKVVGILEYDEKSIDNLNLEKRFSLFSKSPNVKHFTRINKTLE